MIRLVRVSTLSRGREGVEVRFPRLQSDRCQGAVFVRHEGAFNHKLKTWDLVSVNDVRLWSAAPADKMAPSATTTTMHQCEGRNPF